MSSKYYSSQREELHEFLPKSFNRLLDVGCGEGGYGAAVRAKRPSSEIWGVEPYTPAAAIAASRLTFVINDSFHEKLALPDDYFDVITFNDTLEHMADEYSMLQLAHRKLRTSGTLICSVPNIRYLEIVRQLLIEADWQYTDSGVLDRTHLRFFTRKSICRAISNTGFDIKRIQGINSHWWTGWKIFLLRQTFRSRIEDMRWQQFVIVGTKK